MKILFLDFDGVLNSIKWSEKNTPGLIFRTAQDLDPSCVKIVSDFLNKNLDINVVVCSDWRKLHDIKYIKEVLESLGFPSNRIIGITPVVHNKIREFEINEYLQRHPEVKSFVCLDNDAHFGRLNLTHLSLTDGEIGVTEADMELVLKLFKDQDENVK